MRLPASCANAACRSTEYGCEVITRRTILLAPLGLRAQTTRPRVEITWIKGPAIPEEFAAESVVFPRAYTCCPAAGLARRALESGRFPHAARAADRSIASFAGSGPGVI